MDNPFPVPSTGAPSNEESPTRPRPRIESLSDMIFGLALSVGALALVASPPKNSGDLVLDIGTFGLSFLILISVWLVYTRIMSVLPLETGWTVSLNTALLFTVSIEPFLFNVLQSAGAGSSLSAFVGQVYALDLGVMMAVLATFATTLAMQARPGLSLAFRRGFRREAALRFVTAGVFFVSIAPVFDRIVVAQQTARTLLWIAPLVLLIVSRRYQATVDGM
jgi:uncharacterized membrane protein